MYVEEMLFLEQNLLAAPSVFMPHQTMRYHRSGALIRFENHTELKSRDKFFHIRHAGYSYYDTGVALI